MRYYSKHLFDAQAVIIAEAKAQLGNDSARFLSAEVEVTNQVAVLTLSKILTGQPLADALAAAVKEVAENYIPF